VVLFNGREEAQKLDNILRQKIAEDGCVEKTLSILMVGDNASSQKYIDLKKKLCEGFCIPVVVKVLNSALSDEEIEAETAKICEDDRVGGVVIQLPLPRESLNKIIELIPEEKDVDRISQPSTKLSPVIRAFKNYLEFSRVELKNIDTIIIGKGFLVGEPLGHFLLKQGAKVQFILDYKANQPLNCQLLILSAGYPALVKGEYISKGCNVVDFGSAVLDNKTIGDLDSKSAMGHLGFVSPSPGGMGPLVTRYLLMNFLGI
jgi:methylenetetrahydrofolate dehydrogenase (NADP+)/methenyltetrahydrofolate cyclohydrolase